jgi:hypothetical protein
MPYQSLPLASLPKREAPVRKFDKAEADGLLAIVTAEAGATATDGTTYADQKVARLAANKAKRLLRRVVAEGQTVGTRLFGIAPDGTLVVVSSALATGFGWSVFIEAVTVSHGTAVEAPAKSK